MGETPLFSLTVTVELQIMTDLKTEAAEKWSQRGYEEVEIAKRYIEFRPRPPPSLAKRVVEYLKEEVGYLDIPPSFFSLVIS